MSRYILGLFVVVGVIGYPCEINLVSGFNFGEDISKVFHGIKTNLFQLLFIVFNLFIQKRIDFLFVYARLF